MEQQLYRQNLEECQKDSSAVRSRPRRWKTKSCLCRVKANLDTMNKQMRVNAAISSAKWLFRVHPRISLNWQNEEDAFRRESRVSNDEHWDSISNDEWMNSILSVFEIEKGLKITLSIEEIVQQWTTSWNRSTWTSSVNERMWESLRSEKSYGSKNNRIPQSGSAMIEDDESTNDFKVCICARIERRNDKRRNQHVAAETCCEIC